MEIIQLLDTASREVLREWLVENHDAAREVWVTTSRSCPPRRKPQALVLRMMNNHNVMKRLFLIGTTLCLLGGMTAYKSWATIVPLADTIPTEARTDSVKIRGRMMLEFEASDGRVPFAGARLYLIGGGRILAISTANGYGEFSFTVPKGEYTVGCVGNQSYKSYALLLESGLRKANATEDVYLGDWLPVVKEYLRVDGAMQEMKIEGVKINVH